MAENQRGVVSILLFLLFVMDAITLQALVPEWVYPTDRLPTLFNNYFVSKSLNNFPTSGL